MNAKGTKHTCFKKYQDMQLYIHIYLRLCMYACLYVSKNVNKRSDCERTRFLTPYE